MLDNSRARPGNHPDAADGLVEALGAYLKSTSVFPEGHPRVVESINHFLARLAGASPTGRPIEFVQTASGMRVDDREFDGARPAIAWLRERFTRARVAGVRVDSRAQPIALTKFAIALRQSFPPGAPPMAEHWQHAGMGVDPLFVDEPGRPALEPPKVARPLPNTPFGQPTVPQGVPAAASPFPGGMPRAVASPPTGPIARPAETSPFQRASLDAVIQRLSRSDRARGMLSTMHQKVDAEYHGAAHLDVSAMLEAIVGELPSMLCARPDAATLEIESVLDALLTQIDGFLLARPDDPGSRMTHMATTLARRRFATAAETATGPAMPAPHPDLPVGAVVRNPFEDTPRAEPTLPEITERAPEPTPRPASARSQFLDAFTVPQDTPRPATLGPALPSPQAMQSGAALGTRPRLREDSFESFLEGVRSDVVDRESGRGTTAATASQRARLEDSLDGLVEDLRAMPYQGDLELLADDSTLGDGALGAALHVLARARDGRNVAESISRVAEPILRAPTPNQRRILARWLRFAREGGPNGTQDESNLRLFEFLQRNGITQMLSARETLDLDQVVQTFPTQLVAFLDGLDLKDPRSEQTLGELFDKVGPDSVVDAARVLIEDGTLLTPHRTEKILKLGGRRAAGIARAYVSTGAAWTRALVVNFLRRQTLPRQEAAALSIIQPLTSFPSGYLADLCECVARGKSNFKLHGYTSLLLRQYIRDTAENPGDLDRRLYAIRALAHWATPETIQYLDQLSKEGRLLSQTKESRAVRQAATETLKAIRDSNKEQG